MLRHNYAIETLKIEKYRLVDRKRIIEKNEDEIMDRIPSLKRVADYIDLIDIAIQVLQDSAIRNKRNEGGDNQ